MQGIVIDEKGAYVENAFIKLYKKKDSNDETGTDDVTYAETDEDGKFIIQELSPDEKYIIEILTISTSESTEGTDVSDEQGSDEFLDKQGSDGLHKEKDPDDPLDEQESDHFCR